MLAIINMRLSELGLSLAEYIEKLVLDDTVHLKGKVYLLTEEEEKILDKAMKDYKTGKLIEAKDIRKDLEELMKEADEEKNKTN